MKAINSVLEGLNYNLRDSDACEFGCEALWNGLEGHSTHQRKVCEKGWLKILIGILRNYTFKASAHEACCAAIGILLSSPPVHSKFCTSEVLKAVEDCSKLHPDSKQIKQFFEGLKRKEDPDVTSSVKGDKCTRRICTCSCENCISENNIYCTECCAPQKVFRCFTCDKDKIKLYCEVCWKKNHRGHNCEEFFYPGRCASRLALGPHGPNNNPSDAILFDSDSSDYSDDGFICSSDSDY